MSDNNDDSEVYIYQGNDGEKAPETVESLIVQQSVQELPERLCQSYGRLREVTLPNGLKMIAEATFAQCVNLLEMRIRKTVEWIGEKAFNGCRRLTKVEFEFATSTLLKIEDDAFKHCVSLLKIKIPSSVTVIGSGAFFSCSALKEANLSTTGLVEISDSAFCMCVSLQTVSLPNTLERIGDRVFFDCGMLVTVIVPLDSRPISIGQSCFFECISLVNLVLPEGSTAYDENSFVGCELLHEHYSEDSTRIVASLVQRFENFPIHRLCYDHQRVTVGELRECVSDHQEGISLVDGFGMTPFHVLFTTVEPSMELLEVLLDSLDNRLLKCEEVGGMRSLDFLIANWTAGTKSLLLMTLQNWMIDPLARWGDKKWAKEMKAKVGELLCEHEKLKRKSLLKKMYSTFENYEKIGYTSTLELALWKGKLKSGWSNDGSKRQAQDRLECRSVCGSHVVIPNVTGFLHQ